MYDDARISKESMERLVSPEMRLKANSEEFRREIIKIMDNIYFAVGFGAGNSILVEGENGSVLIDTLESIERAEELKAEFKQISSKPIKTIIYTHSHKDHVGGTSVFMDDNPEIISRKPFSGLLGPAAVSAILGKRAQRQFGVGLSQDERPNIGIGGNYNGREKDGFIPPTRQFSEEKLTLTVEGIHLELISAPGETDDQLFVWLPDQKVLISADNYISVLKALQESWPVRRCPPWLEKTRSNMVGRNCTNSIQSNLEEIIKSDRGRETK